MSWPDIAENERRLAAYNAHPCWSDKEMAKLLGISKGAYTTWRLRHKLPAAAGTQAAIREQERRFKAYKENPHLSDPELAKLLGINQGAFTNWRQRNGFTANGEKKGTPMEEALDPEQCEKMKCFLRVLLAARTYLVRESGRIEIQLDKFVEAWEQVYYAGRV